MLIPVTQPKIEHSSILYHCKFSVNFVTHLYKDESLKTKELYLGTADKHSHLTGTWRQRVISFDYVINNKLSKHYGLQRQTDKF